jgi:hypothetical protein
MIESITIETLMQLKIDNYVSWFMNYKSNPLTAERIIAGLVRREMAYPKYIDGKPETEDAIYERAKAKVLSGMWKPPTSTEKEFFGMWRRAGYEENMSIYNSEIDGSPLPDDYIRQVETDRVRSLIDGLYSDEALELFNKQLPKNFFKMGMFLGCLDYIKFLHSDAAFSGPATPEGDRALQAITQELSQSPPAQNTFLPFPNTNAIDPKPTVRVVSLILHYITETGQLTELMDNSLPEIRDRIRSASLKLGFVFSGNTLYTHYLAVRETKGGSGKRERIGGPHENTTKKIGDLTTAIFYLDKLAFMNAANRAKQELKEAEKYL